MREAEIVIVGGGPAGLTAALEAAAAGAEVVLIDEYLALGGQYYKQVPDGFTLKNVKAEGTEFGDGAELIERLRDSKVETLVGTLVWGIFDERTLAIYRNDNTERLHAQKLILAPGAQEVPVAFPGWTLPGVMMGGAAQALMVSQRVLPGQRVVLAGTGPLQLKVASQFVDAGAEVVAILEALQQAAHVHGKRPARLRSLGQDARRLGVLAEDQEGGGFVLRASGAGPGAG